MLPRAYLPFTLLEKLFRDFRSAPRGIRHLHFANSQHGHFRVLVVTSLIASMVLVGRAFGHVSGLMWEQWSFYIIAACVWASGRE